MGCRCHPGMRLKERPCLRSKGRRLGRQAGSPRLGCMLSSNHTCARTYTHNYHPAGIPACWSQAGLEAHQGSQAGLEAHQGCQTVAAQAGAMRSHRTAKRRAACGLSGCLVGCCHGHGLPGQPARSPGGVPAAARPRRRWRQRFPERTMMPGKAGERRPGPRPAAGTHARAHARA